MNPKEDLNSCFFKGKYNEVIDAIGASLISSKNPDFELLTFLQIGSLVFLGHFLEAQLIFNKAEQQKENSFHFKIQCQFFLGIGCVRNSLYSEASKYFSENLRLLRKSKRLSKLEIEKSLFYVYQGSAFFKGYQGQFRKSAITAQKAYEAAFVTDFKFGQILSLEVLGNSLCQLGQIRRGLFELERALKLATNVGVGGVETALRISIITFKSQFGIDLKNSVSNLDKAIQNLLPQDTYSRAELILELARQLTLIGKGSQAQSVLESASEIIYQHQNKRQSAIYNLRYAHLLYLKGEAHAAVALTRSIQSSLNKRVDRFILSQAIGLQRKIENDLNPQSLDTKSSSTLENYFNSVDDRIKRRNVQLPSIATKGEDPLGDLLDLANNVKDLNSYYEIKKNGLLGILPTILSIPNGSKGLYMGPSRNEILIVSNSDVICVDSGLSQPIKKLITELEGEKFKSKEKLITTIWGYSYDPEIHDRLLHSTIGKIRKILGQYSYWLEWSNEGYRLAPFVKVFLPEHEKSQALPSTKIMTQIISSNQITLPNSNSLNIRQIKALKAFKNGHHVGVRDYAKQYKICTMTAYRDLANLHLLGYVVKMGKGRSTVYSLPINEFS